VAGLRKRHKDRTSRQLRDAALRRFVRDGFDATSVDAIAADVEVSPRTFFRYYPTKASLVVTPYVEIFDRWEMLVRAAPAGRRLVDVLRDASRMVTDAYDEDAEFWDRHHEAVTADPSIALRMLETQAGLQQRATRALADRLGLEPRRDLRPAILAAAAMAGVGAAVAQWYAADQQGDRGALIDAAYEQIATAASLLDEPLPPLDGAAANGPSTAAGSAPPGDAGR
jgi:AcrR family transcriptional regulator